MLLFITLFFCHQPVRALYDPRSVPNNKYGVHLADTNDIADAAQLVNSSGGEWGYLTIVIHETDRDIGKWQEIFNQLRRLKIIPIVRLATHVDKNGWAIPRETTFDEWVDFLSKLNWVSENRYVVLFNEPNHAGEWGGELNPEDYAKAVVTLGRKLKEANPDFFILPAGFDASAASDGRSLDAVQYIKRMITAEPEILTLIDGWTSHSYPNPGFSAGPLQTGRGSLKSYEWELSLLRQYGLNRDLPVFITETGWLHNQGKVYNPKYLSTQTVSRYLETAADQVWSDPNIVAVTPFIFSYQDEPFDHFSFKQFRMSEYYPHFYAYQSIPKQEGEPRQHRSFEMTEPLLTSPLVSDSTYTLETHIKNTGQSIVPPGAKVEVRIENQPEGFISQSEVMEGMEPLEAKKAVVHIRTPKQTGTYRVVITYVTADISFELQTMELQIIEPPTLDITVQLGWRRNSSTDRAEILLYDNHDAIIHKYTDVRISNGYAQIKDLRNIVPGQPYRIVLLVPSYLPRQIIQILHVNANQVTFKRFLPLDLDQNGSFTIQDVFTAIRFGNALLLPLLFN